MGCMIFALDLSHLFGARADVEHVVAGAVEEDSQRRPQRHGARPGQPRPDDHEPGMVLLLHLGIVGHLHLEELGSRIVWDGITVTARRQDDICVDSFGMTKVIFRTCLV